MIITDFLRVLDVKNMSVKLRLCIEALNYAEVHNKSNEKLEKDLQFLMLSMVSKEELVHEYIDIVNDYFTVAEVTELLGSRKIAICLK